MSNLNNLRDAALKTAVEHGFKDASIGEDIALMHSELSEALEDHRAGHKPNVVWYESKETKRFTNEETREEEVTTFLRRCEEMHPAGSFGRSPRKPCGIPSELADVIIRILHFAGKHGIDLDKAVAEKMAFNESRPYKHGGKVL